MSDDARFELADLNNPFRLALASAFSLGELLCNVSSRGIKPVFQVPWRGRGRGDLCAVLQVVPLGSHPYQISSPPSAD